MRDGEGGRGGGWGAEEEGRRPERNHESILGPYAQHLDQAEHLEAWVKHGIMLSCCQVVMLSCCHAAPAIHAPSVANTSSISAVAPHLTPHVTTPRGSLAYTIAY